MINILTKFPDNMMLRFSYKCSDADIIITWLISYADLLAVDKFLFNTLFSMFAYCRINGNSIKLTNNLLTTSCEVIVLITNDLCSTLLHIISIMSCQQLWILNNKWTNKIIGLGNHLQRLLAKWLHLLTLKLLT